MFTRAVIMKTPEMVSIANTTRASLSSIKIRTHPKAASFVLLASRLPYVEHALERIDTNSGPSRVKGPCWNRLRYIRITSTSRRLRSSRFGQHRDPRQHDQVHYMHSIFVNFQGSFSPEGQGQRTLIKASDLDLEAIPLDGELSYSHQ